MDHYRAVNCLLLSSKVLEEQWSDYMAWSHFRAQQLTSNELLHPHSSTAHTYEKAEVQNIEPRDAGGSKPVEPSRRPQRHLLYSQPEVRMPEIGYYCVMLHSAGHLQSQSFRLQDAANHQLLLISKAMTSHHHQHQPRALHCFEGFELNLFPNHRHWVLLQPITASALTPSDGCTSRKRDYTSETFLNSHSCMWWPWHQTFLRI